MQKLYTAILLFFITCTAYAQNPPDDHLVYQIPAMQQVTIREDNVFTTINDTTLKYDIYYPPQFNKNSPLPVVIFNNGVGSMDLPKWPIYKDWGRLIAASGMVAINYQARPGNALQDGEALIDFITASSNQLGIDKNKIGLWTCSANTRVGARLAFKTRPRNIKALVMYYGVIDSLGELRQDLPVMLVRAGLDVQFINMGIENFVQSALVQDVRLEFINYLRGMHAFDAFTNTDESRDIIKRTVSFLKNNLQSPVADTQFTLTNRNYMWLMLSGQMQRAITEFRKARTMYRADSTYNPFFNGVLRETVLNANAYYLLQHDKPQEALETFKLIVETYPESPNAYDGLADGYEAVGNKAEALRNARLALEKLDKATNIDAQLKESIRTSANQKIERLN